MSSRCDSLAQQHGGDTFRCTRLMGHDGHHVNGFAFWYQSDGRAQPPAPPGHHLVRPPATLPRALVRFLRGLAESPKDSEVEYDDPQALVEMADRNVDEARRLCRKLRIKIKIPEGSEADAPAD